MSATGEPPATKSHIHLDCTPLPSTPSETHVVGNWNLQHLFIGISVITTAITVITTFILILLHLRYRANLTEQRVWLRIILLPAAFSIFSLVSLIFYKTGEYFDGIPKLYEIFVVASFFRLMLIYINPDPVKRDQYFANLERRGDFRRSKKKHDNGSLRWIKFTSLGVYQGPLVVFILTIINEVVASLMCPTDKKTEVIKGFVTFVNFMSTLYSIAGVFRLYRRCRDDLKPQGVLSKLFCFKALVFLIVHQTIIIEIIQLAKVAKPTSQMSMADFEWGIPEFMICCEMWFFPFLFFWGYPVKGYRQQLRGYSGANGSHWEYPSKERSNGPDGSVLKYIIAVINPYDIIVEILEAFKTLATVPKGRSGFNYGGPQERFSRQDSYALLRKPDPMAASPASSRDPSPVPNDRTGAHYPPPPPFQESTEYMPPPPPAPYAPVGPTYPS